jgi:hypothetical protein
MSFIGLGEFTKYMQPINFMKVYYGEKMAF